jgi:hypothetical protein
MKVCYSLLGLLILAPSTAMAASKVEQQLAKLAPEERAHQACILRGFDVVRKDAQLRGADRMKTSIFGRAVLAGTNLNANGGAVRVKGHWYAMSFSCTLTSDLLKATTFSYELGKEIPKPRWEDLGLWQ